jgi:hypothetical protein
MKNTVRFLVPSLVVLGLAVVHCGGSDETPVATVTGGSSGGYVTGGPGGGDTGGSGGTGGAGGAGGGGSGKGAGCHCQATDGLMAMLGILALLRRRRRSP